jgi:hypothetical protein
MTHKNFLFGLIIAMSMQLMGCTSAQTAAPSLQDGVFVAQGICFGEGDCFDEWRAFEPVPVRERADPASPVIATVAADEWVKPIDGQLRFVPLRGVVRTATQKPKLAVGDVVYMLQPLGEGFYVLWHGGKTFEPEWASGDENEPITWDPPAPEPAGAVLGWWVKVQLSNGQSGWVQEPSFECMGKLQGSEGCRQ